MVCAKEGLLNVVPVICRPSDLSTSQFAKFVRLVELGNEVNPSRLEQRVMKAKLIGFVSHQAKLISVGAIKEPNPGYRLTIFSKSKTPERADNFPFELGWLYTLEQFRKKGLAFTIVKELLSRLGKTNIYATARTDNLASQNILAKFDFKKSGLAYPSVRGDYDLLLFVFHNANLVQVGTNKHRRRRHRACPTASPLRSTMRAQNTHPSVSVCCCAGILL